MATDEPAPPAEPQPGLARLAPTAVIMLVIAALMMPVLLGPLLNHDSFWIDYVWAKQFTALLREGVLYPRWLPWSHDGLGSPVFYYYPPLGFYLTAAFEIAGLSTYGSILAAFALGFAVSGLGTYYWLRGTPNALIGAIFFTLAPYHSFNFAMRGALAESVAVALLPLLAIGLGRIAGGRHWGAAAIAYAAIIMSHLPLALLVSLFFIAPYALRHRQHLAGFAKCCAAGIGLAAIYLVPALGLSEFRDSGPLWGNPYLRPGFWSIFAANWDSHYVGYIHVTILALAVPATVFAVGSRDRWAIYALAILAIALGLVPFVWSLPLLRDVQFPYRILPLAELAIAAAIASSDMKPAIRVGSLAVPLLWSAVLASTPHEPGPDRLAVEQHHLDVTEYVPPGALQPDDTAPWLASPREGRVPAPEVPGWSVQPTFYFPAWSCAVPEPKTKLLMHRPDCRPQLRMTPQEKIGAAISLAALLALVTAFAMKLRRRSVAS